ncbi:MAG: hypothetical protein E7391_07520 [Ruminococcaceae bacterium]|nr:hypothetical protein [Oscillospiraceae bacterium]
MSNIEKIDKNFKVETKIQKDDIVFYNPLEKPFKIYGIFKEDGHFKRIPTNVAESVSDGVVRLHKDTAGGRIRFKTNSDYVAISAKYNRTGKMPHFALTGSVGFDLYADNVYTATFVPPFDIEDSYESVIDFKIKTENMRDITINFPLYSCIDEIYIGLSKNAKIEESAPYKNKKPVVYYGSSITQGGCASRPGNSYQAVISRRLDLDYINLGFSGNAKGEDEMADYIKNLDMEIFVYDYDHNAPTKEHLEKTHERMFKIIREKNPALPIIMMTRPQYNPTPFAKELKPVIEKTYNNAINSGDKNVYLIDGTCLMEIAKGDGTVDGAHPNDLGFFSMAKAVGDVIEEIIKKTDV